LLLDLFHVQMMDGQLLHKLEQVWDQVAIIQISDCPDRTELGLGEVNWPRVLRAIHERGYKGLVEYEIFPSRPGIAGEEAALEALVVADGAAGSQA
jgi:hydroxypyruvate isomerase